MSFQLRIGDVLIATSEVGGSGLCEEGELLTVAGVHPGAKESHYGLVSKRKRSGWHRLDGLCEDGHGYWVPLSLIKKCLRPYNSEMIVEENFEHRGRNLRGMKCRMLSDLSYSDQILVEMAENVGGSGGDGLGKAGHCVLLPRKVVRENKKEV